MLNRHQSISSKSCKFLYRRIKLRCFHYLTHKKHKNCSPGFRKIWEYLRGKIPKELVKCGKTGSMYSSWKEIYHLTLNISFILSQLISWLFLFRSIYVSRCFYHGLIILGATPVKDVECWNDLKISHLLFEVISYGIFWTLA